MTKCVLRCVYKVNEVHQRAESQFFDIYERQGPEIESKLQELFATVKRIEQLEKELDEFKQSLAAFYRELSK